MSNWRVPVTNLRILDMWEKECLLLLSMATNLLLPQELEICRVHSFFKQWSRCSIIVKISEADTKEFSWAISTARKEGIKVGYSPAHDDISIEPHNRFQIRGRGFAGTILLHKILGICSSKWCQHRATN